MKKYNRAKSKPEKPELFPEAELEGAGTMVMSIEVRCYCHPKKFFINGIEADEEDFGRQWDHNPAWASQYGADDMPYCCGDMRFEPKPASPEVLYYYGITEEDYTEVCRRLEEALSFGCCNWCS